MKTHILKPKIMKKIVLIAGFESFNAELYRIAAKLASARCPELEICVFSDRAISDQPDTVAAALEITKVSAVVPA